MQTFMDEMVTFERWSNEKVLGWMETHSATPEMARIFAHLVADGLPWLRLMRGKAVPGDFDPEPLWSLAECRRQLDAAMDDLQAFVRATDDAGFAAVVRSPGPQGATIENTVAEVLTGMFNHAEHHRGQILMLIERETGEYVPSLYFSYLRREPVSARV